MPNRLKISSIMSPSKYAVIVIISREVSVVVVENVMVVVVLFVNAIAIMNDSSISVMNPFISRIMCLLVIFFIRNFWLIQPILNMACWGFQPTNPDSFSLLNLSYIAHAYKNKIYHDS